MITRLNSTQRFHSSFIYHVDRYSLIGIEKRLDIDSSYE